MHFHPHKHNIETFLKTSRIFLLLLLLLFYFNPSSARYSLRFIFFNLVFGTDKSFVSRQLWLLSGSIYLLWIEILAVSEVAAAGTLVLYCSNLWVATQRFHGHMFESYVWQDVVCKFIYLGYTISAFFVLVEPLKHKTDTKKTNYTNTLM